MVDIDNGGRVQVIVRELLEAGLLNGDSYLHRARRLSETSGCALTPNLPMVR